MENEYDCNDLPEESSGDSKYSSGVCGNSSTIEGSIPRRRSRGLGVEELEERIAP